MQFKCPCLNKNTKHSLLIEEPQAETSELQLSICSVLCSYRGLGEIKVAISYNCRLTSGRFASRNTDRKEKAGPNPLGERFPVGSSARRHKRLGFVDPLGGRVQLFRISWPLVRGCCAIFEIEWNRFPPGKPPLLPWNSSSRTRNRNQATENQNHAGKGAKLEDPPTIAETEKMWFRLRFFSVPFYVSPPANPQKTCFLRCLFGLSCFCVFMETERKLFVGISLIWVGKIDKEGYKFQCLPRLFFFFQCFRPSFLLLLFFLSLSLAISFKWCQSFFTCPAPSSLGITHGSLPFPWSLRVCVQIYCSNFIQSTNRKWFWIHYSVVSGQDGRSLKPWRPMI